MKVGIITINDYTNFGNRLQNLALEKILMQFGIEAETIRVYRDIPQIIKRNSLKKNKIINLKFSNIINKLIQIYNLKKYKEQYLRRKENFHIFSDKYLHESEYEIGKTKEYQEIIDDYQCLIVGSDQVWNPNYDDGKHLFFLPNVKTKKISFAASFGITFSDEEIDSKYIEYLKDFFAISVREEYAAEYLKIQEINAICLADPTIILGAKRWEEIIVNQPQINEKYILVYFLGKMNALAKRHLKEIANNNNLKIIDIMNPKDVIFSEIEPLRFIQLIKDAVLVYTDSFHACVFSILFRTPFIVCDRNTNSQQLSSRIDTLLKYFDLEERKIENINWKNVFEIDFQKNDFIIENLQKEAKKFIQLNILE